MIIEALFHFARNILMFAFGVINYVPISYDAVQSLYEILCYGTWVVGADLLAVVCAQITFWIGVRLTVGLISFVWDWIPFV